jgi:hypothetical protein
VLVGALGALSASLVLTLTSTRAAYTFPGRSSELGRSTLKLYTGAARPAVAHGAPATWLQAGDNILPCPIRAVAFPSASMLILHPPPSLVRRDLVHVHSPTDPLRPGRASGWAGAFDRQTRRPWHDMNHELAGACERTAVAWGPSQRTPARPQPVLALMHAHWTLPCLPSACLPVFRGSNAQGMLAALHALSGSPLPSTPVLAQ